MVDMERGRRPKIGYSYPSSQQRQGPAPLASFEDLPSDDQCSPDDERRASLSPDQDVIDKALEGDAREMLAASPTGTLTPVCSPVDAGKGSGSITPVAGDRTPTNDDRARAWSQLRTSEMDPKALFHDEERTRAWKQLQLAQTNRDAEVEHMQKLRKQAWKQLQLVGHLSEEEESEKPSMVGELSDTPQVKMPPDRLRAWQELRLLYLEMSMAREISAEDRARAWADLRNAEFDPSLLFRNEDRIRAWQQLRHVHNTVETPRSPMDPDRKLAWEMLRRAHHQVRVPSSTTMFECCTHACLMQCKCAYARN